MLVVVVAIWAGKIEGGAGGEKECGKGFGGWGGRNMDTPDKIIPSSTLSSNFEVLPHPPHSLSFSSLSRFFYFVVCGNERCFCSNIYG